MFGDWKNQHNKDVSSTQTDTQISHDVYQQSRKTFLVDIDKIILKLIWNGKEIRIGKTILEKNKMRANSPHDFKVYITMVTEIVWCWWKDRPTEQRDCKQTHINMPN